MNETTPADASTGRRSWLLIFLVLLALAPSAYLLVTGRKQAADMGARAAAAETVALALADSLDAARTQLLVDRVLVMARAGQTNQAVELASRFFDRVDERSRVPTAPSGDTEKRLRVLALRDQTIAALTRLDPIALQLIEDIANIHLPLGDPALGARIPATPPPQAPPEPGDTVRRDADTERGADTLGSRRPS